MNTIRRRRSSINAVNSGEIDPSHARYKIEYSYQVDSRNYLDRRIYAKAGAGGPSSMDRTPQEFNVRVLLTPHSGKPARRVRGTCTTCEISSAAVCALSHFSASGST